MRHRATLNPRVTFFVALVACLAAMAVSGRSGIIHGLEMRLYDFRASGQAHGHSHAPIVIVTVDKESLSVLPKWAYALDRTNYVKLVHNLHAAGASVIGLDIQMVTPSPGPGDAALAQAIREAGNVVMVVGVEKSRGPTGRLDSFALDPPVAVLAEAARATASPLLATPDNVVRGFWEQQVSSDGVRAYPALAAAICQVVHADQTWELPEGDSLKGAPEATERWIRWDGASPAFPLLSARDVVRGNFKPEAVRDKIVLVGRWDNSEDMWPTPLGWMQGVEIHGRAVATLLGGPWLRRWPAGDVLLPLLLSVLIGGLGARLRTWQTALLTAAGIALVVCGGLAAFRAAGLWLHMAQPVFVLACVGATVVLMRSERSLALVGKLVPDWVNVQTQSQGATVLVCDIRGYTALSEAERSQEVLRELTDFFAAVDRAVAPHGGLAAGRPGDAAIILFREEKGRPGHAPRAVQAALDLRAVLAGLAAEFRARGRQPLVAGATVATGEMSVGWLGTDRPEPQVIGDPLNVAFRLQEYARETGHDLLLAGETVAALGPDHGLQRLGAVMVRGREAPVVLFTAPAPGRG